MPLIVRYFGNKKPTPPGAGERRKAHPFGAEDSQYDMKRGRYVPLVPERAAADTDKTYDPDMDDDSFEDPEDVLIRDNLGNQRWISIENFFDMMMVGWMDRNAVWEYANVQSLYSEGLKKFETVSRKYRVLGVNNLVSAQQRSTIFTAEECPEE